MYIDLLGMQCLVSLSDALAEYTFPLYITLAVQKPPATESIRAPGPLNPTTLPETEPTQAGLQTVCAMLNPRWPALLAALSFLLTTNLSDSIFDDVLGALQTLARAAGYLALPTPRDAFLTALAKAALPPRVVTLNIQRLMCQPSDVTWDAITSHLFFVLCHPSTLPFILLQSARTLDNFDIVYQLLEETLDAGGHPLTTSPNALRDIVLHPSLITKILSVTGVSGLTGPTTNNMSAFSSPIPWWKAGVRYNNNEIYFDIVETLDAVVNK